MDPNQFSQPNASQPYGQPDDRGFLPPVNPTNNTGAQPQYANPMAPQPWQPGQPISGYQPPVELPAQPAAFSQPGWNLPQQPVAQQAPRPTRQFGAMAELPQLATPTEYPQPPLSPIKRESKLRMLLLVPLALVLIATAFSGAYWLVRHETDHTVPVTPQSMANASSALKTLGKSKTFDNKIVSGLDQTSAFYSVFKNASQQKSVAIRSDVYYTKNQKDARPSQYTLYSTSTQYQKTASAIAFAADSYGSLSVSREHCQDGQMYGYSADGTGTLSWQKTSDTQACTLTAIKSYLNDGLNTAGLSSSQSSTFITKLVASKAITVKDVQTVKHAGHQYLRFDVAVTPQNEGKNGYIGMQLFMNAFAATGLNASTYPYAFVGTGMQGLQFSYYVDAATQLPVYAQMVTTPGDDTKGKTLPTTSYEHQSVEYGFGAGTAAPAGNGPIAFQSWPE